MCFLSRTKFAFICTDKQMHILFWFYVNIHYTIAMAKVTSRKRETDIYSFSDESEKQEQ